MHLSSPQATFLWTTLLLAPTTAQSSPPALHPQPNTFNSTFQLTPAQIAAANLSATLATDLAVALNFERSNWATGSVTTDPFYQPPRNTSTSPAGSLLKHETANTTLYTLPPLTALSRILYQTTTLNGTLVPASASILFPYSPRHFPSSNNSYPVVAWAHATSGIFPACAPSHVRNIWYHFMAPFALVQAGYVVVAPDYQGLGVSHTSEGKEILHPYLAQPSQADDVFYAVQAAQEAYASLSREFVVVGHSQGGGAAWAAAERQARTPVEGYLGAVAGSPVVDFVGDADAQERAGEPLGYLGALLVTGLQSVFPDFDIGSILTEEGSRRWELVKEVQGCNPVFVELLADPGVYRQGWQHLPRVEAYRNMTRIVGKPIAGPLLVVQGEADPVVPAVVIDGAVNALCQMSQGTGIEYQRYKGAGHVPAMYAAQRNWLKWVEERFAGKGVARGCRRREFESALPLERYQGELNWFLEYALDVYETQ